MSVVCLRGRKNHLDIPVLMLSLRWVGEYSRNDYNVNAVRIKCIFFALLVEIKNGYLKKSI